MKFGCKVQTRLSQRFLISNQDSLVTFTSIKNALWKDLSNNFW